MLPKATSPQVPRDLTLLRMRFKSPTPVARACISPTLSWTFVNESLTILNDAPSRCSRVPWSFSSTVWRICSSFTAFSERSASQATFDGAAQRLLLAFGLLGELGNGDAEPIAQLLEGSLHLLSQRLGVGRGFRLRLVEAIGKAVQLHLLSRGQIRHCVAHIVGKRAKGADHFLPLQLGTRCALLAPACELVARPLLQSTDRGFEALQPGYRA
jgi:hypothetical protein